MRKVKAIKRKILTTVEITVLILALLFSLIYFPLQKHNVALGATTISL